jgi:3-phosphoshikimate 1-carboxyvinyltransferase
MQSFVSCPVAAIGGDTTIPGDKSISHRALMLGAIAEGRTEVSGFLAGEDCLATMAAVRSMGVEVSWSGGDELSIEGSGLYGLSAPAAALDMGNSGTAMRLFAGLLCAQSFDSVLVGDDSLSRRPMERVAAPLRQMGADIGTTGGFPPLHIHGGRLLNGLDYAMPVASAQVKSAVLLAGLYARGTTAVSEPAVTRDHTERMLTSFGVTLERGAGHVRLAGGQRLQATRVDVPGDLSSAAFLLLAGCLSGSGSLTLRNVGLNPTRTGVLQILGQMGAQIRVIRAPDAGGEPVGTLVVSPSRLKGIRIPAALVPLAIDEFPLIFVAAALAEGETLIEGAAELRHKESDRIGRMVEGLGALGVDVEERPDGALVRGGRLAGGEVDSHGDHRVAMAFAVGGMAAEGPIRILNTENVATSFPGFAGLVGSLGLDLAVQEPH